MLGERLVELRKNKNMTQEEFADYMGVTRQSVSKWEMNKAYPDIEKIIRICELYEVSVDYLLRGEEGCFVNNKVLENGPEEPQEEQTFQNEFEAEILKEQNDIQEAEEFNDNIIEETTQEKTKNKASLLVCFGISAVAAFLAVFVFGIFFIQNAWLRSENKKTPARVEKVLEQVSVAEVSVIKEDGSTVRETVILDKNNIRQGDYIYTYVDGDNIFVGYNTWTIIIFFVVMIFSVTMVILLKKELRNR